MKKVAVVGAGIAGLVAAHELKKKGFDVTVFEKETRVGGRMATHLKDDLPFNSGATFLSLNYHLLRRYSKEFGVEWTSMQEGSRHRVLRDGKVHWFDMKGPLDILKLSVLSFPARAKFLWWALKIKLQKIGGSFFDLSSIDESLNKETSAEMLLRSGNREVKEYVVDPFTGALHFHTAEEISAGPLLVLMKTMIGNKEFTARYPKGGIQKVPEALARNLKIVHGPLEQLPEGFDITILACPAPAAKKLLGSRHPEHAELVSKIEYASTITISFKVPADIFNDQTHCIYVPQSESGLIASCIFEGRKGEDLIKNDQTLFNVYLWDKAAKELLGKSNLEIVAAVSKELPKVCPEIQDRAGEIIFHDIERWENAMPKFTPVSIDAVKEFQKTSQGKNNLYLIGDYMNSPWTEGAAQSGKRIAELVSNS